MRLTKKEFVKVATIRAQVNSEQSGLSSAEPKSPRPASVDGLSGRELDAAVARRIFGWKSWANDSVNAPFFISPEDRNRPHMDEYELVEVESGNEENAPHYSTNIAAAMEVVEKMRAKEFAVTIMDVEDDKWEVSFDIWSGGFEGEDESLPAAICKAALAAVAHSAPERDAETIAKR